MGMPSLIFRTTSCWAKAAGGGEEDEERDGYFAGVSFGVLEDEGDAEVLAGVLVGERGERGRVLDGPLGREVERLDPARASILMSEIVPFL